MLIENYQNAKEHKFIAAYPRGVSTDNVHVFTKWTYVTEIGDCRLNIIDAKVFSSLEQLKEWLLDYVTTDDQSIFYYFVDMREPNMYRNIEFPLSEDGLFDENQAHDALEYSFDLLSEY